MNNSERLKDYIAMEIANFLIFDGIMPGRVNITVEYPQSQAKINLKDEKIARIFGQNAEGGKGNE